MAKQRFPGLMSGGMVAAVEEAGLPGVNLHAQAGN